MSNIYLHKDKFTLETDKWIEQQQFIVSNHVVYDNGQRDILEVPVLASGKYEALELAKDFLLSRKAFNVNSVDGQSVLETKSFLIQKLNEKDNAFSIPRKVGYDIAFIDDSKGCENLEIKDGFVIDRYEIRSYGFIVCGYEPHTGEKCEFLVNTYGKGWFDNKKQAEAYLKHLDKKDSD